MKRFAIIGSGPAGATAAETLRKLDEDSDITVVTAEQYPFYRREHIAWLITGEVIEQELFEKGKDFYEKIGARFITTGVSGLSSERRSLNLGDGSTINYDSLLIASGGRTTLAPWPGVQLEGVSTLYTLDEARKVSRLVKEAKNVFVLGGGTTAIRVVPMLRRIGLKVTLLEKTDRLWPAMFDRKASQIVENILTEKGAEVLLNDEVSELEGKNGRIQSVRLKSQRRLPCDLLLVTTGIQPNIGFLKGSGIRLDQGVLVDRYLKTNIENVYAAGDVAQVPDPVLQTPALHPTWAYAKEQGEIAAHNMAGEEREYEGAVALFSMNIDDVAIVAAGITQPQTGFEELTRYTPHESLYRKFVMQGNRLVGALLIGRQLDGKSLKPQIRKAVLEMVALDGTKTDLLKDDFDFRSLAGEK